VNLKVEDYYPSGKRFLLRFKEKGGKEKELPVHQKLEEQPGVNARREFAFLVWRPTKCRFQLLFRSSLALRGAQSPR
jgi:hypothetical protein